ncbi:MAG: NADP-dependent phosphogluconate dehydrogenase [Myxococcales bacterium]|nr:NADP-dependent phosphogluconate dehydrogenase [Myxococcales bacterium]
MSEAQKKQIGLVGLAVMGENLALNIEEKGFPIAVWNRSPEKVDDFVRRAEGKQVFGAHSPAELCAALERPRKIILMVKAGAPVDDTIAALRPHLDPGDLLVDGGNEFFLNTERRAREMNAAGFRYIGMGVSGGEEGARKGPSLMPGGERSAYDELAPILTKIAAQVDDGPCVDYMGPGGAGHYVKMVHNGIEYGDMQLIAEVYDLLKSLGGLSAEELHQVFADWNTGDLQSFLIEITAQIFLKKDEETGQPLVDLILDATGMKGTGKWTVEQGAELGAPIPTIAASLEARVLAAGKAERVAASKILHGPNVPKHPDKRALVDDLRHALYASKVCSYAQGMNLLKLASRAYKWDLQLGRIARIWKGGCIIRAQFLDRITKAFVRDAELPNLLVDGEFARELGERQAGWRRVVATAAQAGIPVPSMAASLAYFDTYRRARLPANLTQAQRDFFGAHTFQRTDREGSFHADWST